MKIREQSYSEIMDEEGEDDPEMDGEKAEPPAKLRKKSSAPTGKRKGV